MDVIYHKRSASTVHPLLYANHHTSTMILPYHTHLPHSQVTSIEAEVIASPLPSSRSLVSKKRVDSPQFTRSECHSSVHSYRESFLVVEFVIDVLSVDKTMHFPTQRLKSYSLSTLSNLLSTIGHPLVRSCSVCPWAFCHRSTIKYLLALT